MSNHAETQKSGLCTAGLVLGIILGVVGFIGCGVNYPVYFKILKSRKEKYAFEITELAKEISEE